MSVNVYPTVNRQDSEKPITQIGLHLSVAQLATILSSQITTFQISEEEREEIKKAIELNRPIEFAIVSHIAYNLKAQIELVSTTGKYKKINLENK